MTEFAAADFGWAKQGAAADLACLLNRSGEARFVGGCVRDSLLGLPPGPEGRTDIDIATTLLPEEVMACLDDAGIRHIPTGIEHGTVTAVIDHVPFEITTLRSDVSTDGRRATVAFTTDWLKDASRRDFTINALYLSADGVISDFFGGQQDLLAGHVRFIGDACDRLREDYLRILRFMRFSARYAESFDEAGWSACIDHADGIDTLSRERVWSEMSRLFSASGAAGMIEIASQTPVLGKICPVKAAPQRFRKVHERTNGKISPALGLAALWPDTDRAILTTSFKASNAILNQVEALNKAVALLMKDVSPGHVLYRFGRDIALQADNLAFAENHVLSNDYIEVLRTGSVPVLPLKGADFVKRGIPPGPEISELLRTFETSWIEAGFPEDTETINRLAAAAMA